jgi:hypothetical protein
VLVELTTWKVSHSVSLERKMRLRESERLDLPSSDILLNIFVFTRVQSSRHLAVHTPFHYHSTVALDGKRDPATPAAPFSWKLSALEQVTP